MKITTSKIFTLNRLDFLKGLLTAIITGVIATCGQIFEEWLKDGSSFTIEKVSFILVLKAAFGAGSAYLLKNFFSPSKTIIKESNSDTGNSDVNGVHYIVLALICLALSSCVLTKKQKDRFLAKYCERKDSISYVKKDSIVFRDSLITIPTIVNTPIYLENPCKLLCDSLGNLKSFTRTETSGGLKSTVKTVGNTIVFDCGTDSLKARIHWLEKHLVISEFSHTENTVKKECEQEHRTKFDGFTWWWFWITAGLLTLWLIIKIFKGYIKAYLPFLK